MRHRETQAGSSTRGLPGEERFSDPGERCGVHAAAGVRHRDMRVAPWLEWQEPERLIAPANVLDHGKLQRAIPDIASRPFVARLTSTGPNCALRAPLCSASQPDKMAPFLRNNVRVLLVEDDEIGGAILRDELEALGMLVSAFVERRRAGVTNLDDGAAADVLVADLHAPNGRVDPDTRGKAPQVWSAGNTAYGFAISTAETAIDEACSLLREPIDGQRVAKCVAERLGVVSLRSSAFHSP